MNSKVTEQAKLYFFSMVGYLSTLGFLVLIGYLIKGFVLSKLWLWYIVPALNVEPITTINGIGIFLTILLFSNVYKTAVKKQENNIVELLTKKSEEAKAKQKAQEDKERGGAVLMNHFVLPFFLLFIGWVFSFFV